MKRVLIRVVIFLTILCAFSSAYATINRCEGCSAETMKSLAKSAGDGDHLFFSLSTAVVKRYVVETDTFDGYGDEFKRNTVVYEYEPTAQQIASFNQAVSFYQNTAGTLKMVQEVNVSQLDLVEGDRATTAFDYATNAGLRHRLNTSAYRHGVSLVSAGEAVITGFLQITDASIQLIIKFNDGSVVRLQVRANSTIAEQVGPAEDASGNPIPTENSSQWSGDYRFDSASGAGRISDHLRNIGAHIEGRYVPNSRTIVCRWDGQRTLRCEYQP